MAEVRKHHVPEIDWLKGFAILSVVCIHAKAYEGTPFYDNVINRAVPIFLVLFGITSELWWDSALSSGETPRAVAARWYKGRLARLGPPVWAMSTAWCAALLYLGRAKDLHVGVPEMLATYVGYSPWMGTSWFIVLIVQLVLLFPALRWLVRRSGNGVGAVVVMLASVEICVWYGWNVFAVVDTGTALLGAHLPEPHWYYGWIFVPRVFWPVIAGMYVARLHGARPGGVLTIVAALLTLFGAYAFIAVGGGPDGMFLGPFRRLVVFAFFDVPTAIALLGLFRYLAPLRPLTAFLAWCGRWSWGIYLGHMLVHEVLHLVAVAPEGGPDAVRVAYALFLFLCGVALATSGQWVRRLVSRGWRRGRAALSGAK